MVDAKGQNTIRSAADHGFVYACVGTARHAVLLFLVIHGTGRGGHAIVESCI